jgi:hypothetical protein
MKFVIIKATQGSDIVDSRFAGNVKRARAAGLVVGAYHFFDYTTDGVAQADHFVATARAAGMLTDALPLAVDVECLDRYGWAVWAETQPRLRALVDRIYELTGRKPLLYTSKLMWRQVVGDDPTFGDLPLWVACWRCDKPYIPVGWKTWRFWQIRPYTFPALGKSLDGNIFRGTDASLLTWQGAPILVNEGARITDARLVRVDVSQYDGVEVRTSDDGATWGEWQAWANVVEHRLSAGDGSRRVDVQLRNADGVEGPVLSDTILLDQTPPRLGLPRITVRTKAAIGGDGSIPVRVTWTATDAIAGMGTTTLIHDCGAGLGGETLATAAGRTATRSGTPRRRIAITADTSPTVVGVLPAGECALTVRGQDALGNRAEPGDPTRVQVRVEDLTALAPRLSLGWTTRRQASAIGGSVLRASMIGATLRVDVQGDSAAIVANRGPRGGRIKVMLDSVQVAVVDLYAPTTLPRSVVIAVPLTPGKHVLRTTVLTARNPRSTGRRTELDAIVLHHATDPAPPPDPSPEPSTRPPDDPSPEPSAPPPVDPSPAA